MSALPLIGSPSDYDSLLERVGDARFVLLGEASHGTHECTWQRTVNLWQSEGSARRVKEV